MTDETRTNRLDPLDALRALAIIMIFGLHVAISTDLPATLDTFFLWLPAWAGIWILFILSGYLIGNGFGNGRYRNGIGFIKRRFIRLGVPYYVFSFMILLLLYPKLLIEDPFTVLRIFTFTYNWIDLDTAVCGFLWFVSTLMQFYFISMFFEVLVKRIEKSRYACRLLFVLLFVSGLAVRLYLYGGGYDWDTFIYTPSLTNLDLFFCGFLLSRIMRDGAAVKKEHLRKHKVPAAFSVILLSSLILLFAYCFYMDSCGLGNGEYWAFYRCFGPSLMIAAVCLYIRYFDRSVRGSNEKLSLSAVRKNPFRLVECFAVISLGFYLLHGIILQRVITTLLLTPSLSSYLIILSVTGILTILAAAIFHFTVEKWSERMLDRRAS